VVGERMAVPAGARLIVDGAIASSRGAAVTLFLRIRDPRDGTVLDKVESSAPGLGEIDRAASELSRRALPVVRRFLAAPVAVAKPEPVRTVAPPPSLHVHVVTSERSHRHRDALRASLAAGVPDWTRRHGHAAASTRGALVTTREVAAAGVPRAVTFEVLDVATTVTRDRVPLVRARVRVRVATAERVELDRVIATDSLVGDRGQEPDALAARVAAEVFAILDPHLRRLVPTWR
jgi:hypothetical protein